MRRLDFWGVKEWDSGGEKKGFFYFLVKVSGQFELFLLATSVYGSLG